MNCVAIDDEPLALDVIRKYVSEVEGVTLTATFDDAISGATYLKTEKTDLLFVDINMPDISGLQLVAALENKPMVIFTTAHKKYAFDGFELEAVDYLLKPIAFERFKKAVQKAEALYDLRNEPVKTAEPIIVRSEYKMVKINPEDIEYIEGMEDYIKIHLRNTHQPILTLMSLKGFLEKLPDGDFSRIHRSYIVPNAGVRSISNKKVFLQNGKELTISDSYLDFIEKWKAK
ncbi:Transcriptional regulatory protein YpdB [Dyadobacter sp. CECT 9275]|uniref:Transcriptional regulatory protein YpdB n=1 Tax=Dyadobacter helix TaxID=2822344 RepID=A0A916JIG0_9BACT|nr:LytTR family DNA-binding domain-containing protein [Dyadobacter sp. CECT 9275]CAG5010277.1 Transcriptional regulatory protein YpdB [Dyadobacter sp. CECT 9275]